MPVIEKLYEIYLRSGSVTADSRKVKPGALFFGLRGEHYDGNHFAASALENGAALAVVDNPEVVSGDQYLLVGNTLEILQALAAFHRRSATAAVIGITGSNGKTTTKELAGAVLSSCYNTVFTQGNLNNHIGVPLTILEIQSDTEYAIVEMGANHPGEISALCEIADPRFGIVTNIGKAHLEGFGSFEGVIRAKSELYYYLKTHDGVLFYNSDDSLLSDLSADMNRISYGRGTGAFCRGTLLESTPALALNWTRGGRISGEIHTGLVGAYNFDNVMAAVCLGTYFNVPSDHINQAIANYSPQNNRSQKIRTEKNTLILDAYNANPSSMKAALENFALLPVNNKMAILGDMMELGSYAPAEHHEIVRLVESLNLGEIILVGENFIRAAESSGIRCFKDTSEAWDWLSGHPVSDFLILLKGSRKIQLEKLASCL